ncbi:MAG: hypothetical protein ACPHN2_00710 [Sinimarinibacterium flocculans]|jgi:hypothetical protein|uniref:Uncharacterized protein n=1 Tax=Sinimarinibacterium flocculans TaxID=985250 RepID=A0A318DZX7_9GAMM|nr:hypothetical protein [Sinimarinibacterium flocculans]PXV63739.1 hypothetical protein C8D93_11548 [Sinimarinibacterium flocculans]HBG31875.1 hypothetical protein [Gammaproteobacteria bacterium]
MLTPELTWIALISVQTLHLLHHRLAKRHISLVEVSTSAVLMIPPQGVLAPVLLMTLHGALIVVQIMGSISIQRFSPQWENVA